MQARFSLAVSLKLNLALDFFSLSYLGWSEAELRKLRAYFSLSFSRSFTCACVVTVGDGRAALSSKEGKESWLHCCLALYSKVAQAYQYV